MRILHLIESLAMGGAENLLTTLLPELARHDHDVLVGVLRAPYDLEEKFDKAGVPVIKIAAGHKWRLLSRARDLSDVVRRHEVDVVHAHLYFPAVYTAFARRLGLLSAGTVVTFHNLAYQDGVNTPGLRLAFKKRIAASLYPVGMDRMTAVSEAVARHYKSELSLDRVEVIHNPIDPAISRRVPQAAVRRSNVPLTLVLPGRLVHEKGHAVFIAAVSILRDAGLEFNVVLAGGGKLHAELSGRVRRHALEDRVSITGTLGHSQMLQCLESADIVVIPSLFEGFGMTAIEAMALSRPVVVTAVGGLLEIVDDEVNGLVVPAGDAQALADAVSKLMTDPELRARLGSAGKATVESRFALSSIAQQYVELYASIGRPAPGRVGE